MNEERYGSLVVIERYRKNDRTVCRCLCDCGGTVDALQINLRAGRTSGCPKCRTKRTTKAGRGEVAVSRTRDYGIWWRMRDIVSPRWDTFEKFHADVGPVPAGMTIGRIDLRKPVGPNNWRFEPRRRINAVYVTIGNHSYSPAECAAIIGCSRTYAYRLATEGRLRKAVEEKLTK